MGPVGRRRQSLRSLRGSPGSGEQRDRVVLGLIDLLTVVVTVGAVALVSSNEHGPARAVLAFVFVCFVPRAGSPAVRTRLWRYPAGSR